MRPARFPARSPRHGRECRLDDNRTRAETSDEFRQTTGYVRRLIMRRRLFCAALLALLAAGCGGDLASDPPPPAAGVIRLFKGQNQVHDGIEVRVQQVSSKNKPPKAALSLTDTAQLGSLREVVLAVGESTVVGPRRIVLVAAGKGAKEPYVDFRLEPLEEK